jgi:hypothetical protein
MHAGTTTGVRKPISRARESSRGVSASSSASVPALRTVSSGLCRRKSAESATSSAGPVNRMIVSNMAMRWRGCRG